MIKRFFGEFPTELYNVNLPKFDIAACSWTSAQAVAAETDGIIDGGECSDSAAVTLTPDEGTEMPCARNITATVAATTEGNIKAVKVKVYGTNILGEEIDEELPAFTVDTAGSVVGSKAFATVTKVTVPAMDGTGVTVDIGWGDKLGLPVLLDHNAVLYAVKNHVRETTAPTVGYSSTDIESNTIDLYNDLDGKEVEVYFVI